MRNIQRAFTLIELLVVIAIIAILAAILFPVFAAAKDSAKDVVALSNCKQAGTSMLMYSIDHDDVMVLTAKSGDGWATWQQLVQPYCKSWDLMFHPKLPIPSGNWAYWQRLQHWGVAPRAESVKPNSAQLTTDHPSYWEWTQPSWAGGKLVRFTGITGAGIATASGSTWYNQQDAPSISVTAVSDPSTMWLAGEAGNWDMWWGISGNAFGTCHRWSTGWQAVAGAWDIHGPHARKRTVSGLSGFNTNCAWPNGFTTYVATDGSAKAFSFRGYVVNKTVDLGGGVYALRVFWPN